jgi:hypothetical protein
MESALPVSPTGFFGRGEPSRPRKNVNSRSQYETQYETQYENGHDSRPPSPGQAPVARALLRQTQNG